VTHNGSILGQDGRARHLLASALSAALVTAPVMASGAMPDDGRNFSNLEGITPGNVRALRHAWVYRTGDLKTHTPDQLKNMSFQPAPRIIAGNVVFCTPFNEVIALDPVTGRQRWRFDAKIDQSLPQAYQYKCRGPLPSWTDPAAAPKAECATRIFMATLDQRMVAIDARSGRRCRAFGRNGEITVIAKGEEKYPNDIRFLSMPIVVRDRLILGSAMTDNFHVDNPSGKVRAFDVRTGALSWTFDPVPRTDAAPNRRSWATKAEPINGGANVWTLIASDPAAGLVYLPTTSPTVDHFGGERPGGNLFADSLVALDAETGRMRWYRQFVHHDIWDYDLPSQPIITDLEIAGRKVPAIIQNTKMGFVYVLDRLTGAPVYPIEERPVPQHGVPGEHLSPTQPFPANMPSLVPTKVEEKDIWGVALFDKMACLDRFHKLRNEGIFTPPSTQGTLMRPSFFGGANWGGASYNAKTGVMITPVITVASILTLTNQRTPPPPPISGHVTFQDGPITFPAAGSQYRPTLELFMSPLGAPCTAPPWFTLVALDVKQRKILWRVPLGTVEEQLPLPIPLKWGTPSIGGLVSTAGGVTFIGATLDRKVRAFDSRTGEELWSDHLPTTTHSFPLIYRAGGYDYVLFVTGGHTLLKSKAGDWVFAYRVPTAKSRRSQ
jgi:quinoprotein glucose dehydrogenase